MHVHERTDISRARLQLKPLEEAVMTAEIHTAVTISGFLQGNPLSTAAARWPIQGTSTISSIPYGN
jgi:hypothetical protein